MKKITTFEMDMDGQMEPSERGDWVRHDDHQEFFKELIYDFLSELTNDDTLGEARIETIKRLAEKWGVRKNEKN